MFQPSGPHRLALPRSPLELTIPARSLAGQALDSHCPREGHSPSTTCHNADTSWKQLSWAVCLTRRQTIMSGAHFLCAKSSLDDFTGLARAGDRGSAARVSRSLDGQACLLRLTRRPRRGHVPIRRKCKQMEPDVSVNMRPADWIERAGSSWNINLPLSTEVSELGRLIARLFAMLTRHRARLG